MTLLFPLREPASPQERDQQIMELALRQARNAWQAEEVPVGAIIVRGNQILGRGANGVEALKDATAHAEMLALTQEQKLLRAYSVIRSRCSTCQRTGGPNSQHIEFRFFSPCQSPVASPRSDIRKAQRAKTIRMRYLSSVRVIIVGS